MTRIFTLTSNAYVGLVPGFAFFFNRYWSPNQGIVLVGYDQLPPLPLPRNFTIVSLGQQERFSWTAGLRAFLERIPDEIILLFLEDYYLCNPVDTERVAALISYMEAHPEVAKIDLTDDRLKTPYEFFEDGLIRSADDAPFQMSLQAALWRREFLLDYLKGDETPWMFEKNGTRRLVASRRNGVFNGLVLGCQRPPVRYVNVAGGGAGPGNDGKNGTPMLAKKRVPDWMWQEIRARNLITGFSLE